MMIRRESFQPCDGQPNQTSSVRRKSSMERGIKWWLLLLVILSWLISSPIIQKIESSEKADLCNKLKPCELLTQADAERILGQSVRLIGERSESRGEIRQCSC